MTSPVLASEGGVIEQERHTCNDGYISRVKNEIQRGQLQATEVEIEEIRNRAMDQAIKGIGQSSPDHQPQSRRWQRLAGAAQPEPEQA